MDEERMSILKMIESGTLSAQEGMELLAALDQKPVAAQTTGGNIKWLRVRVYDMKSNRQKVNVNIPYGLVKFGLKFVPKEYVKDVNMDEIMEAVKNGEQGKIVDIFDEEDGVRVEVTVE
ncbi:hypothetical protein DXT63_16060 [Thermoanaerobacteraceae bacterium SP2]|nr:hypothetical protein DXT63_16060 [Thermoanaerobacteraceae bacterium SP2]